MVKKIVTTQEAMMDEEEGTTKYAKGAKREAKLLFKDESYKIVVGYFKVYKEKRSVVFSVRAP